MDLTTKKIITSETDKDPTIGKNLSRQKDLLEAAENKLPQLISGNQDSSVKDNLTETPDLTSILAYSGNSEPIIGDTLEKTTPKSNEQDLTNNNPTDLIIQQLNSKKDVNGANGVFLGDSHGDYNIVEFLTEKMPEFKKAGINKFYMEMIEADSQVMIDRYYEKGDNENEIVEHFKNNGWEKTKGTAQNYFNLIKAAKENGIKVYGIDESNESFMKGGLSGSGPDRLTRSNPLWTSVIKEHTTPGDKYIVYGGLGHSANYPFNKGVDQMLGDIPSLDFDTSKNNKEEIQVGDGKANDFEILLPKSPNQPKSLW